MVSSLHQLHEIYKITVNFYLLRFRRGGQLTPMTPLGSAPEVVGVVCPVCFNVSCVFLHVCVLCVLTEACKLEARNHGFT